MYGASWQVHHRGWFPLPAMAALAHCRCGPPLRRTSRATPLLTTARTTPPAVKWVLCFPGAPAIEFPGGRPGNGISRSRGVLGELPKFAADMALVVHYHDGTSFAAYDHMRELVCVRPPVARGPPPIADPGNRNFPGGGSIQMVVGVIARCALPPRALMCVGSHGPRLCVGPHGELPLCWWAWAPVSLVQ